MRTISLKKCKRIQYVFFATDGSRLLAIGGPHGSDTNVAISINVADGEEIGRVELHDPPCYNVDPAQTRLVIGEGESEEGNPTVRWGVLPRGSAWRRMEIDGAGSVSDVSFDRTGTMLAVASEAPPRRGGCKVDVFRFVPNETPRHLLSVPTKRAADVVEFNADGTRLAVSADVRGPDAFGVFDLGTQTRVFQFDPKSNDRVRLRFLPDDRAVVACGPKVFVLPSDGGEPEFVLGGPGKTLVNDVAVTPDGSWLVGGMSNGTVRFWDANTGEPGPTFDWGVGGVWSVALAPDGLTCAAAGTNGRIVIWDVDV